MKYLITRIAQGRYFLGLIIGVGIVLAHLLYTIPDLLHHIDGNQYLFTPYTQWISFNTGPWTIGLFLSLPLLSALSTSQIVGEDIRSGFFFNILRTQSLNKYLFTTLAASFIGGAFTTMLPLLIDFFGVWSFLPSIIPNHILNANMPFTSDFTFFHQCYYNSPQLLVVFYVLLPGAISGLYALFSSILALYTDNLFITLGTGFTLTMILNVLATIAPSTIFSPVLISIGRSPLFLPNITTVLVAYCTALLFLIALGIYGGHRRANV